MSVSVSRPRIFSQHRAAPVPKLPLITVSGPKSRFSTRDEAQGGAKAVLCFVGSPTVISHASFEERLRLQLKPAGRSERAARAGLLTLRLGTTNLYCLAMRRDGTFCGSGRGQALSRFDQALTKPRDFFEFIQQQFRGWYLRRG